MTIKSVEVRNLLSFGPKETYFEKIRRFNLFIGRNGSGKTNFLRVLGDLRTEFSLTGEDILTSRATNNQYQPLWTAKLSQEFKNFNLPFSYGDLSIEYTSPYESEIRKVIFKNGCHIEGDFTELLRLTTFIGSPAETCDLGQRLEKLAFNSQLAILNFGLETIFGLKIGVGPDGLLYQKDSDEPDFMGGRGVAFNYQKLRWPSGFLGAISILLQFLCNKHIILIEEPECSLEPIRCRFLIRFLIWLTLIGESDDLLPIYVQHFRKDYSEKWCKWISRHREEYNMEEESAKDFTCCINTKQIFVSSHAPHLIQEFLALGATASIYEFNLEKQDNSIDLNQFEDIQCSQDIEQHKRSTLFTSVRLVQSSIASILDNIGANGSDLLQANGVIWVEGPQGYFIQK